MVVSCSSVEVSSKAVARSTTIALTRWILNASTTSLEVLNTWGACVGLITDWAALRLVVPIWTPMLAPFSAASDLACA